MKQITSNYYHHLISLCIGGHLMVDVPPCHHRATHQLSGNDLEHRQKVTQKVQGEYTGAQTAL